MRVDSGVCMWYGVPRHLTRELVMNFNRVILGGNLTRDPEIRYVGSANTANASFGMAMSRKYRGSDGTDKEEVTFVDVESWGNQAETIAQYFKKGRPIFVEGRLKLDQWEDKQSGDKRSKIRVIVESFQFVDSGGGKSAAGKAPGPAPKAGGYEPEISEEDFPF